MIPPSFDGARGPNPIVTQSQQPGVAPAAAPNNNTASSQTASLRLLLICQAEGMHSRYTELSTEDSGLTARGWEQTNVLAAWLAVHEKIDLLISAPQLRSRLTAQRIGQAIGRPIVVQQDLPHQPRSFTTPNVAKADVVTRFPPLHIADQFPDDAFYSEFGRRMGEVLDRLMEEHAGKTVAIVMDGNGVATALRHFLNAADSSIAVNHTSLAEVIWQRGRWCLMYANRMEHAPQGPLPKADTMAEQASAAELQALDDELSTIAQIYNRVLTSSVTFDDPAREQRIRHLIRFANLPTGLRILDVGTGNGRLALMLAEDGAREVIGIDISPAMLEVAEYLRASNAISSAQRISYRLASAQNLPFRSEGFDAIVCRLVLHHAHKPEDILRELVRLLKPGGTLILADLLATDDPVRRATQNTIEGRRNPSHVAMLTADQYRKLVAAAGLTLENEAVAVFERELEDWLNDLQSDPANRLVVREMIEAGLETDATGLKVRKQGNKLVFDQRLLYIKATKSGSRE